MPGREHIPVKWGGGFIVTGACGHPHLVGKAWRWWQCSVCHDLPNQLTRTQHRAAAS